MDGEAVLRAMGVQLVVLARSVSEGLSAIAASPSMPLSWI
jgi:hypothetical protein